MRVAAGLSHANVKYLRSLAEHVVDGSLALDRLDDEVTAELVAINGVGPGSADLFLMFQLHRPDVLPTGDLGIRRAVMQRYGLDAMPKSGRGRADRRAVAALPDAGEPVSLAVAQEHAAVAAPPICLGR